MITKPSQSTSPLCPIPQATYLITLCCPSHVHAQFTCTHPSHTCTINQHVCMHVLAHPSTLDACLYKIILEITYIRSIQGLVMPFTIWWEAIVQFTINAKENLYWCIRYIYMSPSTYDKPLSLNITINLTQPH